MSSGMTSDMHPFFTFTNKVNILYNCSELHFDDRQYYIDFQDMNSLVDSSQKDSSKMV